MTRTFLIPALLGAVFAMPVAAQDLAKIGEIDVTVELTALENAEAAAYWKNLEADLEGAIAAQLTDRLGDAGMKISVDVSEVELASAFEVAAGLDQSMLRGQINVTDVNDNSNFNSFDLAVSMEQATVFIPEGVDVTVLTPTSAEVYSALVTSFAQEISTRIDG
jgi:hypothetical protein